MVARNVAKDVELPPEKKPDPKFLAEKQVRQFLDVARGHRLYAAFLLDLGTDLRRSELLALRWQNVDLEAGTLRVMKGIGQVKGNLLYQPPKNETSWRTVPMPRAVLPELKRWKVRQNQEKLLLGEAYHDSGLVFAKEDGTLLKPRTFYDHFKRLAEKAELLSGVTLHSLRHTFGTLLLQYGVHSKVVQELMGHSDYSVTMDTYSHVMPPMMYQAVNVLDDVLGEKKDPFPENPKEGN